MKPYLPPIRRIVTDLDATGRSVVVSDGESPNVKCVPDRPGYRVSNLWRTEASPPQIGAPDTIEAQQGVLPPKDGTILRIIDYPPEPDDPEDLRRQQLATFRALFPDAAHAPDGVHPGLHTTRTIDYAIVLSGEITAILDDCECVMRAGDVLIQRGTAHGWANRSGEMARIAFVLIDAT